jgi:hypothetical protein
MKHLTLHILTRTYRIRQYADWYGIALHRKCLSVTSAHWATKQLKLQPYRFQTVHQLQSRSTAVTRVSVWQLGLRSEWKEANKMKKTFRSPTTTIIICDLYQIVLGRLGQRRYDEGDRKSIHILVDKLEGKTQRGWTRRRCENDMNNKLALKESGCENMTGMSIVVNLYFEIVDHIDIELFYRYRNILIAPEPNCP